MIFGRLISVGWKHETNRALNGWWVERVEQVGRHRGWLVAWLGIDQ